MDNSSATITNTAITGNFADGGGLYLWNSSPSIRDTIIAFNWSGVREYGTSGAATLRYNCVYGNTAYDYSGTSDPTGTDGNISADPLFVRDPDPGPDGLWGTADDDFGDLRLKAGSPCINAGDPGFVASPGETDLDSHARVLCGQVDMGAHEFGIGDYDCNQTVDLADLSAWDECQTGPRYPPLSPLGKGGGSGCEAFDFDSDGDVDLGDFAGFQRVFAGQ